MAESVFRAIDWALELPVIRDGQGRVDRVLHAVAVALARKADGRTGADAWPSYRTLAQLAKVESESAVADALARGEALGLWADEGYSTWNTVAWQLNIDDESVIERLEKLEQERFHHKRQLKSAKNQRHYARKTRLGGSEEFSPTSGGLKTRLGGSSAPATMVLRPSGHGLKTQRAPDNQSYVTSPGDTSPSDQSGRPVTPPNGGDRVRTPSVAKVARKRAFVRGLPAAYQAGFVTDEDLLAIIETDTTALTEAETVALGANSDCPIDTDENQWAWLAARPSPTSPYPPEY